METLWHAAQSLVYSSVPLGQITHSLIPAFPVGHSTVADPDSLAHTIDRWTEFLEKLFIHVAVFLYLVKKSAGELARLLRGASKSVLLMVGVVAPIGRPVVRALAAVGRAVSVVARLISAVISFLIRQIKRCTARSPL
jgi:hypothetical protein